MVSPLVELALRKSTWDQLRKTKLGTALTYYYSNSADEMAKRLLKSAGNEMVEFTNMFTGWKEDLAKAYDIASEDEIDRLRKAMNEMAEVYRDTVQQLNDFEPEEEVLGNELATAAVPIGTAAMDRKNSKGVRDDNNRQINARNKTRLESLSGKVKAAENDYHNKAEAYEQAAARRDKFDRDPVGVMTGD